MSVRLTTERLTLRPLVAADAETLDAINADPEIMRYIGDGRPKTTEATRAIAEKVEAVWAERGWGTFAVVENESGTLVGIGVMATPSFLPEILPATEVGWRIKRDRWGRGYAPEAARAVVGFAFDELGLDRVVSCIHVDNTASIRVAEKLGMTLERETIVPGLEVSCRVYELKA
ncbi:GNAT family N-acetyltransferase [Glycomyces sp. TRM65418]|uniref:GNAT family N-acetyltransferase n=1 Tax=Glycomyces sp. TRM65418 TaxID=2867006 RepID=UPI001CE58ABB|nr:GNAT family N-acetyltransferase [Glycomyces sp. TRM65418]MCC3765943.1 GNAT family N-acetyltransferase [Glycomyces sp. TRM65418]QZD55525.1 GNAT family N-acetyltransferase [Glycomyces sp. TRM65418]